LVHILQIYKDYPPVIGGIEHHLRDLSEGLVARGHRVTTLYTSTDRQTGITMPQPGLTLIAAARTLHAASTPLSIAMLAWARRIRADIVHLHFPYPPGDLAALLAPNRPPLVVTYHSDIVRQQRLLHLYRPLLNHTLNRAARITATSPQYVASSPFLAPHSAKCAIVPLGIDTAHFTPRTTPRNPGPLRILFVGRLRYYKGLHVLIDAMAQVHSDAELLIAGTGPERSALEAQAQHLGVSRRVRFLGDIADTALPDLYRNADLFVLPAHLRAEALGIAMIEAIASGVPCISTELGTGTSYVNINKETGIVVPPGDPAALAGALNTLLADEGLRARYGAAGRARALERFSIARMLDGVERVYADCRLKS
jgi:rhamnosyl/mannosyltransferase